MENESPLLDTPKKQTLQHHHQELRSILKEFERNFVEQTGRKPKQADIKENATIARKYKEYYRLQDVLSGKLAFEEYNGNNTSAQCRKTRRSTGTDARLDVDVQTSKQTIHSTPRKHRESRERSSRNGSTLNSPNVLMMSTIGPTPHRDGKVLGLFDLMTESGLVEDASTPSSSTRKRKIQELYADTPVKRPPLRVIQTPSQKSSKEAGDLLGYLTGTPNKSLEIDVKKHSRTPQSEGRKFQLSQFFATPTAQRFLFADIDPETGKQAIPNDLVASQTPQRKLDSTGLDATPAYLRRSISFKDRLMSATKSVDASKTAPSNKTGPPTLRHFRSSTSNILRIKDIPQRQLSPSEDNHDDDLEALRELEFADSDHPVLFQDNRLDQDTAVSEQEEKRLTGHYKKKGQKRTTRKSNIKPVAPKLTAKPKFVVADPDSDDDDDNDDAQSGDGETSAKAILAKHNDNDDDDDEKLAMSSNVIDVAAQSKMSETEKPDGLRSGQEDGMKQSKRKAGMINPNARSHQNFRSLKIRNKNSKAKSGGKSRFGKGRR